MLFSACFYNHVGGVIYAPPLKIVFCGKKSFKKKNYVKIMTKNLLRISTRKKQPWAICIFLTDKFECTLLGNHFRTGP